jgi:hypothetical protein
MERRAEAFHVLFICTQSIRPHFLKQANTIGIKLPLSLKAFYGNIAQMTGNIAHGKVHNERMLPVFLWQCLPKNTDDPHSLAVFE